MSVELYEVHGEKYCTMCHVSENVGCACPESPCPSGLGCFSLCRPCEDDGHVWGAEISPAVSLAEWDEFNRPDETLVLEVGTLAERFLWNENAVGWIGGLQVTV